MHSQQSIKSDVEVSICCTSFRDLIIANHNPLMPVQCRFVARQNIGVHQADSVQRYGFK
jgi:hypothetical protein